MPAAVPQVLAMHDKSSLSPCHSELGCLASSLVLAPPAWVLPLPLSATFAQGSLPSAGASLTARGALHAGPGLQNFWDQLAAVEQLSTAGTARLLHLGNNAHFPLELLGRK